MTVLENHITDWSRQMWPHETDPDDKRCKLDEEFRELFEALDNYESKPCARTRAALMDELADVGILIAVMAGLMGLSLQHYMGRKQEDNVRRGNGEGRPIKT